MISAWSQLSALIPMFICILQCLFSHSFTTYEWLNRDCDVQIYIGIRSRWTGYWSQLSALIPMFICTLQCLFCHSFTAYEWLNRDCDAQICIGITSRWTGYRSQLVPSSSAIIIMSICTLQCLFSYSFTTYEWLNRDCDVQIYIGITSRWTGYWSQCNDINLVTTWSHLSGQVTENVERRVFLRRHVFAK
jgi:hypothetical protein